MQQRNGIWRLLVSICMTVPVTVAPWAQAATPAQVQPGSLDVAVLYTADGSNRIPTQHLWMQGGSLQVHGQFWHGLGVVADVMGEHTSNMARSDVGLDLVTATFGPRYTWQPEQHKYALFGQVLVGEANALHSVFPAQGGATDSDNSLALKVGGGLNYWLSRHFAVRAFEADWVRTQLPNGSTNLQNYLQLGAGIVLR